MVANVIFRNFEKRDIDFVYKCKNNKSLNSMIVGQFNPISYKEAETWVLNCMKRDKEDRCFWAIATNDDEKRIIGWAAIAEIDRINNSCSTHSIVINDPDYNDGFAWLETVRFMFEYAFETLNLNRVYGVSIVGHPMSNRIGKLMYMQTEGVLRQACYKDGVYYDLQYVAILKDEYQAHKNSGDYDIMNIIRRLRKILKEEKK